MNKQIVNLNTYKKLFTKVHGFNPYQYQLDAVDIALNSDISVHCWSRRIGKTFTFATLATLVSLVPNANIAILAPTLKLTNIIFKQVYKALNILGVKLVKANFKDHYLELENDSTINCCSLKNISQILGQSYHLILIDEAAIDPNFSMKINDSTFKAEEMLSQDIIPTLLEYNGKLIIFSTPRGKNLFYKLFNSNPHTHYTIYDQKHIPLERVEALRKDYEARGQLALWQQEFEAKFVNISQAVFTFIPQDCYFSVDGFSAITPETQVTIPADAFDYFISIDPGYVHPFAISLLGVYIPNVTGNMKCDYDQQVFVIIDCYKESKAHLKNIANKIHEWEQTYPILEYFCDNSAANIIDELADSYNLSFRGCIKNVEESIIFAQNISKSLYINKLAEHYEQFLDEWVNYQIVNNKIKKINDDLIDAAVRYGFYSAYKIYYPDLFLEYVA